MIMVLLNLHPIFTSSKIFKGVNITIYKLLTSLLNTQRLLLLEILKKKISLELLSRYFGYENTSNDNDTIIMTFDAIIKIEKLTHNLSHFYKF
jgi:hypothetical protein